jgi:hypothetical protein
MNQILDVVILLLEHTRRLSEFNIYDPNYTKNADEFIKIAIKDSFQTTKAHLENILKQERQDQPIKGKDECFYTNGPKNIFKILNSSLQVLEIYKISSLLENLLVYAKEILILYMVGIQSIVSVSILYNTSIFIIELWISCN